MSSTQDAIHGLSETLHLSSAACRIGSGVASSLSSPWRSIWWAAAWPASRRTGCSSSYWGGAALAAVASIFLRRHIPESPRWLMTHGREAERTVDEIEASVTADGHTLKPATGATTSAGKS